jgi:hypothetical protein
MKKTEGRKSRDTVPLSIIQQSCQVLLSESLSRFFSVSFEIPNTVKICLVLNTSFQ